jgi:Flp pilus assembly protein TadD
MAKNFRLLPLLALVAACTTIRDFEPGAAFDMPSVTEKGYAALAAGNYPTAVRWLLLATKDKPDDPYLMLDLAAAYQKLGKFAEAERRFQTVVDTAREVTPAKVGDSKLQGKTLAQIAATDLAACSSCDMPPEAGKGYSALAEGDGAAAVHWLSAASAARPDDLYFKLDLAAAEQKLGQIDAARKLYQTIVTPPPPAAAPAAAAAAPILPGRTLAQIAAADLELLAK